MISTVIVLLTKFLYSATNFTVPEEIPVSLLLTNTAYWKPSTIFKYTLVSGINGSVSISIEVDSPT